VVPDFDTALDLAELFYESISNWPRYSRCVLLEDILFVSVGYERDALMQF